MYHGITNVGCKPTIEGDNPVGIETHIFDFNQDVYDKIVIVTFIKKLREERKFSNIEKLLEQMRLDVSEARYYFSMQ